MAIKNEDFITADKPFEEAIKNIDDFIKQAKLLNDVLSKDLKKTMTDFATNSTSTTVEKLEQMKKVLAENNKEIKQATALQKELTKVQDGLTKANAEAVAIETKEYKELQRLNQENAKRKKDLQDEVKLMRVAKDSLAAKEIQLKRLREQYRGASADVAKKMLPEIQKLDKEVKSLNSNIGQNQGKVGGYFKSFVDGAKSMALAYISFQGFKTLITNITGTLFGFEKAMSGVKALTNATDEDFKKLSNDAQRLGAETSKTAIEVAKLQQEYAKLGFSTQEILDATEATIMLSQATDEDLARSAEIAGATIRGFGMNANETYRVVDVMASSFTSSALNLERFAEAMKYVAPVAKASGISLEETTAMMSKLADAGIHGSMAGTALRQILLEIAKTGKPTREAMEELTREGLSLADANDEVGQRAATALLILSNQAKGVEDLTVKYQNAEGSAKKMAETQMDNVAGSVTYLSSAWDGLILRLSGANSSIKSIVDALTNLVNWLNKNLSTIGNIVKVIGNLTLAYTAYNVALKLSNSLLITNIANIFKVNAATTAQSIATRAATAAQTALNTAMKSNPIGLVVSALIIAVPLIEKFSGGMKDVVNSTDELQKGIDKLNNEAKGKIEAAIVGGKSELEAIRETIKIYEDEFNDLARANDIVTQKLKNADEEKRKALEQVVINVSDGLTATGKILNDLRIKEEEALFKIAEAEAEKTKILKQESEKQKTEREKREKKQREDYIKNLELEKKLELSRLKGYEDTELKRFLVTQKYEKLINDYKTSKGMQTLKEDKLFYAERIKEYEKFSKDMIQAEIERLYDIQNAINNLPQIEEENEIDWASKFEFDENGNIIKNTKFNTEILDSYKQLATGLDSIMSIYESKWADLVSKFADKINEQQQIVNNEAQLMSAGLANTYAKEKEELTKLTEAKEKAMEKERRMQILMLRMNQLELISNYGMAASNIWKEQTKKPYGWIEAIAATAVMIGQIAATESKLQSLKKYKKGGLIEGASHEQGGVPLVQNGVQFAEAEGGEYIVNKAAYQNAPIFTSMINEGKITDKNLNDLKIGRTLKMAGLNENTSALNSLTKTLQQGDKIATDTHFIFIKNNYITKRRR